MSTPTQEVNIVGVHCYAGGDLDMSASLTSAQTSTSTTIYTGAPATVIAITQLSSGSATLKMDKATTAAAIDFGSPTTSLALSGTTVQALLMDTDADNMFVGLKVEPGVSGAVFDEAATKRGLTVFVLYERKVGQNWLDVASSINMIMSELNVSPISEGDGSGVVPQTFAKDTAAI